MDVLLGVVHDRAEYDDDHDQGEHEEAQLAGARRQRVTEDAEPGRVARELEDAKHAEDPERYERAADVVVVGNAETDVVRKYSYDVDNAHYRPHVSAYQQTHTG